MAIAEVLVLDSSAILNDFNFHFESGKKYFLTAEVVLELKGLRPSQLLENALSQNLAEIKNPEKRFFEKIESNLKEKGIGRLSRADKSVLALAMELAEEKQKFEVLTDDYSLQNCLKFLKIPFSGILQGEIKKVKTFRKKCGNCGKYFSKNYSEKGCDLCGNKLK